MNLATVRMIAWREITQRLRTKAFRISTALVSAVLVIGALLPTLLGGDDDGDDEVAGDPVGVVVVGEVDADVRTAIEVAGIRRGTVVEVGSVPDRAAAEAALRDEDGDVEVAVIPGVEVLSADGPSFGGGGGFAGTVAGAVAEASVLADAGLSAETVGAALLVEPLPVNHLDVDAESTEASWLLANLGAVFIYATLIMYAAWMVNGIIEEKANRVVELLLSSVKAKELMAGKILGLGAVGIVQTVVIFVPALAVGAATDSVVVPAGAGRAAAVIIGWWLLGYLLYSVLSAAAGALVSRSEESQVILTPVTVLLVISYFFSFAAMSDPDGTVATVASLVPFSASVTMVVRMLLTDVPWWQVATSAVLTVVTAYLLTLVAARIYAGGLLRTGRRVGLRQAWAGAKD